MANGYRRTVAPRQGDGAIELVADIGFILRIVEKHFALNHLHAGTCAARMAWVLPMVTLSRK